MEGNGTKVAIGETLLRGLRRRCPRCGKGRLFSRGIKTYERCSECNLLYQRDRGDTWMFMIITDRIPILSTWPAILGFFGALAVPVLATLRERQGLALALDYLVRVYVKDPSLA